MESKENSIALIINRKYLLISKKMTILKYDQVNLDDINYSKPEKMGTSYFGSFSFGETLQPLYIQTPKVKCNVNVSDLKDKKNPYLEIEIPKNNFDLYDLFLSIDDQNIKNTLHKSEEWFQKEIPLEAIDDMYKRITKPFKKGENPTMKFRLPVIKNEIQTTVYNQQRVFVNINDIKEDSEVILILHLRGLKFLKQHFYCDCYISQIKLFQDTLESKFSIMKDYSLIDEDGIDTNDIFDEEITNAFKNKKDKDKDLEKERLEKERIEKEKLERIRKLQKEIELKNKEVEELQNN
jgi:hypothetical protein